VASVQLEPALLQFDVHNLRTMKQKLKQISGEDTATNEFDEMEQSTTCAP
jgi:hypothetical protein